MSITSVNMDSVTVMVERTIAVGTTVKINPSEAYLGIDSGNITIVAICTMDLLEGDAKSDAEEFTRIHLDMYDEDEDMDDDEEESVYTSERTRLHEKPWVTYEYRNGDTQVLPLEEFVDHTMMY